MKVWVVVMSLVAAMVAGIGEAQGEFLQGNDLYNLSREYKRNPRDPNRNDFGEGVLLGFVIGVHDASKGRFFCPPSDKSTMTTLVDIVIEYLKEHPENINKTGNELVTAALKKAFPCKK